VVHVGGSVLVVVVLGTVVVVEDVDVVGVTPLQSRRRSRSVTGGGIVSTAVSTNGESGSVGDAQPPFWARTV
jgi:hypothetical protein